MPGHIRFVGGRDEEVASGFQDEPVHHLSCVDENRVARFLHHSVHAILPVLFNLQMTMEIVSDIEW